MLKYCNTLSKLNKRDHNCRYSYNGICTLYLCLMCKPKHIYIAPLQEVDLSFAIVILTAYRLFYWGSCYSIFSFICMFCRSLFVLLYFFFWSLCCLFFFDLRILITPLASSNSFFSPLELTFNIV